MAQGTLSCEHQRGQSAREHRQGKEGVNDKQNRVGHGRGVERPQDLGPINGQQVQKHTGFEYEKGKQNPATIMPLRVGMYFRNQPGDHRRKQGQENERVAEASMVYEVIDRAAEGDKDIQIG